MRTLRTQLILSHSLPLFVVMPLTAIVLIFVLESQVLLVNLSAQLVRQAELLATVAQDTPELWEDVAAAERFIDRFNPQLTAQLSLIQADGTLLASSNRSDAVAVGRPAMTDLLARVQSGEAEVDLDFSRNLRDEIVDVLVPVVQDGEVIGIVRLVQNFAVVSQRFERLRTFIVWSLAPGLVLGIAMGLLLAYLLEAPLLHLSERMNQMASGEALSPLPEQGPAELQALSRTFNLLIARLHALEETRRQLLANLVHEIGRPLGALRSATDALLGGAAEQSGLRHTLLTGIDGELQRLQRLLDDLARIYDQVTGTLVLQRRPIALSEWLAPLLAPWGENARRKGIDWRVSLPADLPSAHVDPDRLGQALGNLLSNAIKYTPEGGSIDVTASVSESEFQLRVADSGPGIPVQEHDQIFEPFFRSHSIRRFPQGLGLGLTIARELTVAHGGRLILENGSDLGSCFLLALPLHAPVAFTASTGDPT